MADAKLFGLVVGLDYLSQRVIADGVRGFKVVEVVEDPTIGMGECHIVPVEDMEVAKEEIRRRVGPPQYGADAERKIARLGARIRELESLVDADKLAHSKTTVVAMRLEAERQKFRSEPGTCNSGHTKQLPLILWDCPACTDVIRHERDSFQTLLTAAKVSLEMMHEDKAKLVRGTTEALCTSICLRDLLADAYKHVVNYAHKNPKWKHGDREQDPLGVHALKEKMDAELKDYNWEACGQATTDEEGPR